MTGSLYEAGWRQGTIVSAALPCDSVYLTAEGYGRRSHDHDRWILVSQDCDLDGTFEHDTDKLLELRPLHKYTSGCARGIRSRRFRIDGEHLLEAQSERVMIAAAALTSLKDKRLPQQLGPELRRDLKKWLGLRYDRPAIPKAYEAASKRLAEAIAIKDHAHMWGHVEDIVATYRIDPGESHVRATVYAIMPIGSPHGESVRRWLERALGLAGAGAPRGALLVEAIDVVDEREFSLHSLKNTFGLDVSDLSPREEEEVELRFGGDGMTAA